MHGELSTNSLIFRRHLSLIPSVLVKNSAPGKHLPARDSWPQESMYVLMMITAGYKVYNEVERLQV
jgi:hypothetical protein